MDPTRDLQNGSESRTSLVEQISACLNSGRFSQAIELLRKALEAFPNDPELAALEKLAQDGVQRQAEADRLITESQNLFAQQKSSEAIQLLRQAYDLDQNNSLARTILANALVEHAISIVQTDWWQATKLSKQALELNPAHPTAKTIRSLISDLKKAASVDEWASQVGKLQSTGDLFAALSLIEEGLDIHPRDPKLLLIQDAIQRDQDARRRQNRRHDLEDLRRMESELEAAADGPSKEALAERIQAMAAKYWTDGEVLSVANGLLQRLGLVAQASSAASPHSKRAPVIFHVPRATPSTSSSSAAPGLPNSVPPVPVKSTRAPVNAISSSKAPPAAAPPLKVPSISAKSHLAPPGAATVPPIEPAAQVVKGPPQPTSPTQPAKSKISTVIIIAAAAVALIAATFFITRGHYAPIAKAPTPNPPTSTPPAPTPVTSAAVLPPAQTTTEPALPPAPAPSDSSAEKTPPKQLPPSNSAPTLGTLLVIAGQDNASVLLNGSVQPHPTQGGQLRIPNLELGEYVVQVSKTGFQNPPPQKIRIRNGQQAVLAFNLQPQPQLQPRLASLAIQGGSPGTTVLIDQTVVGTVPSNGALSVPTVTPGDHTIELRKAQYKPRQFKKRFVEGETVSLAAADTALEAAPGELKITFTPPDANVAIVKGDLLKIVSSGVPLSLPAGSYTLTARTADRFTRSSTLEIATGQAKTLDLSLAPNGMSKWEDSGAWKKEGDSFTHRGGDFVLYGVVPISGTFVFSAMPVKGHVLQWVLNYTGPQNYILYQLDDNAFSRTVIRNGQRMDEFKVAEKGDKKSFRMLQIRVSPAEVVHQIKREDSWIVLDRLTLGTNLSQGKFGFYLPGNDQIALSNFVHYPDLNLR